MAADTLYINGQNFVAVRIASRNVSYSKDYITRLAREQKIRAVTIGRTWYVDPVSLKQYGEIQTFESEIKRRQLQQQRRSELQLREQVSNLGTSLSWVRVLLVPTLVALLIIGVGFFSGVQLGQLANIASVAGVTQDAQGKADVSEDQVQSVLTPVFLESNTQAATVDNGRQVSTPDAENGWLRIWYE